MNTLFLKELRQWWKLGLGLAVVNGLMHTACLNPKVISNSSSWTGYGPEVRELLTPWYQGVFVCTAALTALVLGLAQWMPETPRDQWAFLIHRPLSRYRLFAAKACAGLVIYAGAVMIPWLLAAGWLASPGHLPSVIEWRMLIPGSLDIVGAWNFYFAGVMLSLRQARWMGSRALPVFASLLFMATAATVSTLPGACVAVLIGLALSGVGAWTAFRYAADNEEAPLPMRVLQGIYFSIACILPLWCGVALVSFAFLTGKPRAWEGESYFMSDAGELLIGKFKNGQPHSVVNTQGEESVIRDVAQFYNGLAAGAVLSDYGANARALYTPSYRASASFYAVVGSKSQSPRAERWVLQRSTGRIHGFSLLNNRYLGSIGPKGFVEAGDLVPEGDRFSQAAWQSSGWSGVQQFVWSNIVPGGDTLYYVEPMTREVRPEMTFSNLLQVSVIQRPLGRWLAAYEPGKLHLKEIGANTQIEAPVRVAASEPLELWVYMNQLGDRIDVLTRPVGKAPASAPVLDTYNLKGELKRSTTVASLARENATLSVELIQQAFVPPVLSFISKWEGNVAQPRTEAFPWQALGVGLSSGIVLGVFGWLARGPLALRCFWVVCGFLAGMVGVLAFVALRNEESWIRCVRCGRDHSQALDCGARGLDRDDGTSIFAELAES